MTVENTNRAIDHLGTGSTTVFSYNFLVYESEHMTVYLDGVLQSSNNYTVQGLGEQAGGTVTFNTAPADQVRIDLIRVVPNLQKTDYRRYDPFPSLTHEKGLDLAAMGRQQLVDDVALSLQHTFLNALLIPNGLVLPAPEPNKVIGYDGDLNLVNVTVGVGGTPVVNPLQETLLSASYGYALSTAGQPQVIIGVLQPNAGGDGFELVAGSGPGTVSASGALLLKSGAALTLESAANSIYKTPVLVVGPDAGPGWVRALSADSTSAFELWSGSLTAEKRRYQIRALVDDVLSFLQVNDNGTGQRLSTIDTSEVRVNGQLANRYDISVFWPGDGPPLDEQLLNWRPARPLRIDKDNLLGSVYVSQAPDADYTITARWWNVSAWEDIAVATIPNGGNGPATWTASGTGVVTIPADTWFEYRVTAFTGSTVPQKVQVSLGAYT